MSTAIFGISNSGLNLIASLFVLMLVVVWLALIVYTYLDAKRRVADPFLVACATIASFIPYLGTAVYVIVRPPEFLEDAHERELEIKAAEMRVRQLIELSCPNCEYPIEKSFLRCPQCQRRLKDPCTNCDKPVDPRWAVCPYCEVELAQKRARRSARPPTARKKASPSAAERTSSPRTENASPPSEKEPAGRSDSATRSEPAARSTAKDGSSPQLPKRSTSREPDPNPRQA
jgi:hypothetical protein